MGLNCSNCGTEIVEGFKFCENCGTQVVVKEEVTKAKYSFIEYLRFIQNNLALSLILFGLAFLFNGFSALLGYGMLLFSNLFLFLLYSQTSSEEHGINKKIRSITKDAVNSTHQNKPTNVVNKPQEPVASQTTEPVFVERELVAIESNNEQALIQQEVQMTVANEPVVENNNSAEAEKFKIKKKGFYLNLIIIFVGALPLTFLTLAVLNLTTYGSFFSYSGIFLILIYAVSLLGSLIFYLPTLICHAPGKIVIFILNIVFGATLIGWVILLFVATSKNRNYAYQEEMLHYARMNKS